MAELAMRIGVGTDSETKDHLYVALSAVVTGGERFQEEDSGSDKVFPGKAAVHIVFEGHGDDIVKGPKIEDDSVKKSFRPAIFVEEVTEEDAISTEVRALTEVRFEEKAVTLVGKRAIAIALRELERD